MMTLSDESIQIVVLDCPVRIWNQKNVQDLFHKVISLKLRGYGAEYPSNVVPVDKDDMIGTHVMICEKRSDGSLLPFSAYKSVSIERCNYFRSVFPAHTILRTSKASDELLQKYLADAKAKNVSPCYDSAWTILPEFRGDRVFTRHIQDIVTMLTVFHHQESKTPWWTTVGIKRFKTDQYFLWMGHEKISDDYKFYGSFDEPACLFGLKTYSKEALAVAEKLKYFWDNRIVLSEEKPVLDGVLLPKAA